MERVLTPLNIWFACMAGMLGAFLFVVGVIRGGANWLDTLQEPTQMFLVGFGGFVLFFPLFACLHYCRILLRAVCDLEQKVERLSHDA
jgi:hypothetical protein